MLVKASCVLLLATTALAAKHHEPYGGIHTYQRPQNYAPSGAVYPIDYNQELTMKNPMVRPGNNIIFNFEQTRRDQPPLVDIREEDIGKYIGRRRTTTTTPTPFPTIALASEESSEEIDYDVPVPRPVNLHPIPPQPQHWSAQNLPPVMLPTGTTSKPVFRSFHDFSDSLDIPDSSRIDPKSRYPDVDRWPHVALGTPPPPPTPKWEEFEDLHPHQKQPINRNYYQPHPTEYVPMHIEDTPRPTQQVPQRKVHRHGNRGNRKHTWEDVKPSTLAPTVVAYKEPAAVPTPVGRKGLPSAVPTLTPWSGDSF